MGELCCVRLTTTPCTTTTHLICSSFTCPPAPWTKVLGVPVCAATGCTEELCCVRLTTTPCTTTTHLTCSSFTCPPAPWTKVPGDPVCAATGCTEELCCVRLTTTHAMRLYSAGEEGVVQKALAVKQNAATSKVSFSM